MEFLTRKLKGQRLLGANKKIKAFSFFLFPFFLFPFFFAIFLISSSSYAQPEITAIHAGHLLAVPGETVRDKQTLLIQGGRVSRIAEGYITPPGSRVIDLSCCYVLPGLIDLHVHLTTPAGGGSALGGVTETPADLALMAAQFARLTLAAGFTTVLDMGTARRAHEEAIYALRRATASHQVPGPRVLAVGSPISLTGMSRTAMYRTEVEAVVAPEGVCDGADDCRRAVREQIKRGADIINFYNTGSLLDEVLVEQTFTEQEMRAIVETAHALGRKVIADGHTAPGVNAALRAGVDIVDTMPWPDDETWRLLKKHQVTYVPHLHAYEVAIRDTQAAMQEGKAGWISGPILQRLLSIRQTPYSAQEAHKQGITIVLGSDAGVIEHGDNSAEFNELVKVGMTPVEAIAAATVNAAAALGMEDQIGTLRPGGYADLIAVAADPLQEIGALRKVVFVMREGVVYKRKGIKD